MVTKNKEGLKEQIEKIISKEINSLKKYVAEYIIDSIYDYSNIKDFFRDLNQHGCVSGMIGSLIYYKDTSKFYDKYENDIEELLDLYRDECGYKNRLETMASLNGADNVGSMEQEKNLLAWFGFERQSQLLADEIGLEI